MPQKTTFFTHTVIPSLFRLSSNHITSELNDRHSSLAFPVIASFSDWGILTKILLTSFSISPPRESLWITNVSLWLYQVKVFLNTLWYQCDYHGVSMTKVRDIAPYSVRMPDSLKRDLTIRASKNGRSLNSEIVMILQAAIDEEKSPRSIEGFAQQESEKFREALLKTLSSMYGEDKKPTWWWA